MDKCDECGKRVAKDIQICRACYKKYLAYREKLEKEAREECARALGLKGSEGPV